jgi:hypothetical protein
MAGNGIEPFDAAPQLTDGSASTQTFDDPARILFGADGRVMGAPPHLMVIDHGSARGVVRGQRSRWPSGLERPPPCFRWLTALLLPLPSPN